MSDEGSKIENHTLVLLREIRDRLDRIEGRLDGVEGRLEGIEGTQAEHSQTLAGHSQTLAGYGQILAGHGQILAEHSQTLAGHGKLLEVLVKAVKAIDANQETQTAILKEHSKKLEELTEQGRNHGARMNAMDGRLGIIEKHIGLVSA